MCAGEIALPGGKAEEGDEDDGATATREAEEEIGLDPSLVNVVSVLEPFLSKVCDLAPPQNFWICDDKYSIHH